MTATITSIELRMPHDADERLPVVLIDFDASAFVPSQFEASGIACPPNVQRSVTKRQAEFHYGRLAARHAMEAAGIAPAQVGIGAGREPVWPDGIVGSITHSAGLAGACVLRHPPFAGVGLDVEHIVDEAQQHALLTTAVTPAEVDVLREHAGGLPLATLLTIAFSAKESFFKGVYGVVRRYLDFESAPVSAFDPERRTIVLTLQETLGEHLVRGQACTVRYEPLRAGTVITAFVR